jgi:hypothetical protein
MKAGEPEGPESFGPLPDVSHIQAAEPCGLLQGFTLFEEK